MRYTEQEARAYAQDKASTIVIRSHGQGVNVDTRHVSSSLEAIILEAAIYGALLTIRQRTTPMEIQAAKDTAEYIANLQIPGMNGYESVYIPIQDFIDASEE